MYGFKRMNIVSRWGEDGSNLRRMDLPSDGFTVGHTTSVLRPGDVQFQTDNQMGT